MGYAEDGHEHGKRYNEELERNIAAWHEYKSRQRSLTLGIVLVILALCILFALFDVRLPT